MRTPGCVTDSDLKKAILIRRFEERLLALFSQGVLNGTVHTCIGEEWIGVSVARQLRADDWMFSNHRGHGHYLARYEDAEGLLAEIMGKSSGVCGGMGGSQHIYRQGFLSNGIQGGMFPVAVGRALALKQEKAGGIAVVFIGDGTTGEGAIYEGMNLAAIWKLPLLIVLENNGWAQSTDTQKTIAGSIAERAKGFGLDYRKADTWALETLFGTMEESINNIRAGSGPILVEVNTFRLMAHSKSDDNRDKAYVQTYFKKDALTSLLAEPTDEIAAMDRDVCQRLDRAQGISTRMPNCAFNPQRQDHSPLQWHPYTVAQGLKDRISGRIYEALKEELTRNPGSIILGEDIEAPYGGAFKVTKDLSALFPDRVLSTPISESAIVGVGTGLATSGRHAIVEIMFGDFLTLGMDQLLNHASKFVGMYGRTLELPLIVRCPMGGRRGYGPTHSQSIEKFFLGIPNLRVIALNHRYDVLDTYRAIFAKIFTPTLVIENKILYTKPISSELPSGYSLYVDQEATCIKLTPSNYDPDISIVCYGETLLEAESTIDEMIQKLEIIPEIVAPLQLYPLDIRPIQESVSRTKAMLIIEEGCGFAGFGSEVLAQLCESHTAPEKLVRLSYDDIIPSSFERECALLPNRTAILNATRRIMNA